MCDDKNCQSTKSVCDDKNCQSTKCVHMWKTAMQQSSYKKVTQSTHFWSVLKTARKQIGTQPEVTRNCQDSTSKCWYPSVSKNVCPYSRCYKMWSVNPVKMQSYHIQPVKSELKKLQVNTRSQGQTSKYKRDTKTQA